MGREERRGRGVGGEEVSVGEGHGLESVEGSTCGSRGDTC